MNQVNNTLDEVRIAVVGHIDHGKSTLVGRLLLSCAAVSDDRRNQMTADQDGLPIDLAFVTDQLRVERQQRITVDTAHAVLRTGRSAIVFIDTPGHRELVGNMLSGVGMAHAAVLVVDAAHGTQAQTGLHLDILQLLGIDMVVVCINKMDLVDYSNERFSEIRKEVGEMLNRRCLQELATVPVSASTGWNIIDRARELSEDHEPLLTVLSNIRRVPVVANQPVCLPVQDVLRHHHRQWLLGRIESGVIRVGDQIRMLPEGQEAVVKEICVGMQAVPSACAGASVAVDADWAGHRGNVAVGAQSTTVTTQAIQVRAMPVTQRAAAVEDSVLIRSGLGSGRGRIAAMTERKGSAIIDIDLELESAGIFDTSGHATSLSRVVIARRGKVWGVGTVVKSWGDDAK